MRAVTKKPVNQQPNLKKLRMINAD